MNSEISWYVELVVKPGQLDRFYELTREMVNDARLESGVLTYERFLSEDGRRVYVYERYADSPSAVSHLNGFITKH